MCGSVGGGEKAVDGEYQVGRRRGRGDEGDPRRARNKRPVTWRLRLRVACCVLRVGAGYWWRWWWCCGRRIRAGGLTNKDTGAPRCEWACLCRLEVDREALEEDNKEREPCKT